MSARLSLESGDFRSGGCRSPARDLCLHRFSSCISLPSWRLIDVIDSIVMEDAPLHPPYIFWAL